MITTATLAVITAILLCLGAAVRFGAAIWNYIYWRKKK